MKKQMKRLIAALLAVMLVFNTTACAKKTETANQTTQNVEESKGGIFSKLFGNSEKEKAEQRPVEEDIQATVELQEAKQEMAMTAPPEYDRDSMEQIAEMLSSDSASSKEIGKMSEEELNKYVEDLLEQTNGKSPEKEKDENKPDIKVEDHEDDYDENGAMKKPFDQIYPELVEKEEVAYDDETLLIKMSNNREGAISDAMKSAGVATLETVVPMEKSTWFEAKLKAGTDANEAVKVLRELSEIQMVDYNYAVEVNGMADAESVPEILHKNPHHEKQWHLKYCKFPAAHKELKNPGGSPNVVVAVIDTGVDYDHEDLSQNIWKNAKEVPDNGRDDDGNGYIDDYYGVNIVAGTGNGDDDNGHGTHVAGIIAAQDNNTGVVGMAYNVKVMPIKAAMSSGTFLQSDIAKAIIYAYENGAEVINMSFGGSACSIAVQDALEVAYSRCVLVASAGNDTYINEVAPRTQCDFIPNYPAAFSYVIGVMSVGESGVESGFTNIDGKLYTKSEYEVYAPGEGIMSTIPNNQYASWSGTSMAAPVVSSVAAILRSEYSDRDKYPTKFIYGQITATSDDTAICCAPAIHGEHNIPCIVNLHDAIKEIPTPDVGLYDYALFDTVGLANDTIGKNNGDGVIDAGETIALGLTLRNRWGLASDTTVKIDTLTSGGMTDPYITIINPEVNYGAVGTYSTADCGGIYTDEFLTGWENPFYIKVAEDCPNDYIFKLNVTITAKNGLNEKDNAEYSKNGSVTLTVRSGMVLPAVIDEDMTLTSDSLYIIPNGTTIKDGVTVKVEPGTHIQFWSDDAKDPYADKYIAGLDVKGRFLVNGTKENPVYIYPSELMDKYNVNIYKSERGYVSLKYAVITNFCSGDTFEIINKVEKCVFKHNYADGIIYRDLRNGIIYEVKSGGYEGFAKLPYIYLANKCAFYKMQGELQGIFNQCIFVDSAVDCDAADIENSVFLGNIQEQENGKKKVSTYTVSPYYLDSFLEQLECICHYNSESGTTYVEVKKGYSTEECEEAILSIIQQLGGDYIAIESVDEKEWIDNNINGNVAVNVIYDEEDDCYLWSNGENIDLFVDPDRITKSGHLSYEYMYYSTDDRKIYSDPYESTKLIFEIPGEIYPEDIQLDRYSVDLDMEGVYQIIPTALPATDKFVYESKDKSVAVVSDTGLVTPIGKGTTDIFVYSFDKAVFTYLTLNVVDYVALETINLASQNRNVIVGESFNIEVSFSPENTTRQEVTFASSDESVATIDKRGNVTAVGRGTAVLTATSSEGISTEMVVNVHKAATELKLEKSIITADLSDGIIELPEYSIVDGEDADLQWKSTDESVAVIEDKTLKLVGEGTTAIVLSDTVSGISAYALVYVVENGMPAIVKTMQNYSHAYSLTENGELYRWNWTMLGGNAILDKTNVLDFNVNQGGVAILTKDGLVCWETEQSTDFFKDKKPMKIEIVYHDYNKFVLTEEGFVYSWGRNNYGMLGLGHMEEVAEPTLINIEGIVDIANAGADALLLLNNKGEVYALGGEDTQYMLPTLIATNIISLQEMDHSSSMIIGKNATYDSKGNKLYNWIEDLSEFDIFAIASGNGIAVKNGNLYKISYNAEPQLIPVNATISSVYCYEYDQYHVATTDGMLYAFDGNNLAEISTTSLDGDNIILVSNNLEENNVLSEEKLVLNFNKIIKSCSFSLYANGNQVPVTVQKDNNLLIFSRLEGFETKVDYKLVINSITGIAGTKNKESIEISFTSDYNGVISDEKNKQIIDTPTIHVTERDEAIERFYWSPEVLIAKIKEIYALEQINFSFYNNVILNHISTETNPENWFRVIAPQANYYEELPLGGNYWGTTNETAVGKQIVDYKDYNSYLNLLYDNYLTEAPENTFPFVTDVTVLNKNGEEVSTVGNEEITVCITFNRDMETNIPLNVTFGSSAPYADYRIEGKYVDSRTWKGTYVLNTLIEGGANYFKISNGCSAEDDLDLYEDTARFKFDIDNTAAQALIMQGYATDTGIQLSWTQDDFETLMGYNVYRSTSEDGYYQRINNTIIPTETKELFDDTVEPGVMYYYNFTVVQTDMKESVPSGKITIMSKDTMAPNIYHTPVYTAYTGANIVVSATVTDNLNLSAVKTFYRTAGTEEWNIVMMSKLNDKYSAIIPADVLSLEGLEYYIEAYDGINYTYKGSADVPYLVTIQQTLDANALGDVNGDGKISNLDALMLLQAINDKLNLTADQFTRADLDGNGILQAFEALRILQYVSGSVGSVDMR